MAKTLTHFSINGIAGDGYLLQLEDEDGETLEFEASFEQLDLIVEEINKALDADEEDALEVDEDRSDDDEE